MSTLKRSMIWSTGTMVLTLVHHFYGAIIYDEPFRLHVAIFAIPVIIVILASYIGSIKIRNVIWKKTCLTVFLAVSVICSVAAIGVYEGGYNHVLKNILYFSGVPTHRLDQLYVSVYELPNNFIFELTGIAQFFTGIKTAMELWRLRLWHPFKMLKDPT